MVNRVKRIHPLKRLLNHSFMPHWRVKQAFSNDALRHIEQAITVSELSHSGQVRFAIEASLSLHQLIAKLKPSHRAIQVFSDLRVWDTEQNNGVLIYLLLADRDVEIVADRGIHQHVGTDNWEAICLQMESRFKLGDFEAGQFRRDKNNPVPYRWQRRGLRPRQGIFSPPRPWRAACGPDPAGGKFHQCAAGGRWEGSGLSKSAIG